MSLSPASLTTIAGLDTGQGDTRPSAHDQKAPSVVDSRLQNRYCNMPWQQPQAHRDVGSRAKVRTKHGTGCADRAQGGDTATMTALGLCIVLERKAGAEAQTPG